MRIRNIYLEITPILLWLCVNICLLIEQCEATYPMTDHLMTLLEENYGEININRHDMLPHKVTLSQSIMRNGIIICNDGVYDIDSVYGRETNNSVRLDFAFEITGYVIAPGESVVKNVGPALHALFSKSFFQDEPPCDQSSVKCVHRSMTEGSDKLYESQVPNVVGVDAIAFKSSATYSKVDCEEPRETCEIMIISMQLYTLDEKVDVKAASLDRLNYGIKQSWFTCAYPLIEQSNFSVSQMDSYESDNDPSESLGDAEMDRDSSSAQFEYFYLWIVGLCLLLVSFFVGVLRSIKTSYHMS